MDQLCAHLEISRNYCLNCGSWKTLPLSELPQITTIVCVCMCSVVCVCGGSGVHFLCVRVYNNYKERARFAFPLLYVWHRVNLKGTTISEAAFWRTPLRMLLY